MNDENNQEQQIKLVILGLENAGKTTIVDLLKQRTEVTLRKPPDMYPTKGVERRSLFQGSIMVWDLGGQEVYRNEYLMNPESYFKEISFCYYVIDVQDYYRLAPSTMYFMGAFNLIKKYSPDARIVLLFHKMDPNFNPNIRNLRDKFLEKIEPFLLSNDTSLISYETTIFDLNTIKTAFSQEIVQLSKLMDL
ncbi:MAG: ADP-ribosylation factor-like protein [Promethearchaeota archaeon]|jgi:Ras-related GTP-binding protein A/B